MKCHILCLLLYFHQTIARSDMVLSLGSTLPASFKRGVKIWKYIYKLSQACLLSLFLYLSLQLSLPLSLYISLFEVFFVHICLCHCHLVEEDLRIRMQTVTSSAIVTASIHWPFICDSHERFLGAEACLSFSSDSSAPLSAARVLNTNTLSSSNHLPPPHPYLLILSYLILSSNHLPRPHPYLLIILGHTLADTNVASLAAKSVTRSTDVRFWVARCHFFNSSLHLG